MIMTRVLVLASALAASAGVFATAAPKKPGKAWADSDSSGEEGFDMEVFGWNPIGADPYPQEASSPVAPPTQWQPQLGHQPQQGSMPKQPPVASTQRRQGAALAPLRGGNNKGDRRPTETEAAPVVAAVEAPPQEPVPQWKRFVELLNKAEDEIVGPRPRGPRPHGPAQLRPKLPAVVSFFRSNGFQVY